MNKRRVFWRNYSLELGVLVAAGVITCVLYALFRLALGLSTEETAFVSIAGAGSLFIVGQFYSLLKDRRDGRRRRAQELFYEWHSKEIRESRVFVSRYLKVHESEGVPLLGQIEEKAASEYKDRYEEETGRAHESSTEQSLPDPDYLDNIELQEFHFFRIYQFFERWMLLVKNADIDHKMANDYMGAYTRYYLDKFIEPWAEGETNEDIKRSLEQILDLVGPD